MSRSNWTPSVNFKSLEGLERCNEERVHLKTGRERIPARISKTTWKIPRSFIKSKFPGRIERHCSRLSAERNFGKECKTENLLAILYDKTTREVETNLGPPQLEQTPNISAFQDGRFEYCDRFDEQKLLFHQIGPERCVSFNTNSRGVPEISWFQIHGRVLSVCETSVWAFSCTEDIHQGYERSDGSNARKKHSICDVSRRYFDHWRHSSGDIGCDERNTGSFIQSWFHDKHEEVMFHSSSSNILFRNGAGLGERNNSNSYSEDTKNQTGIETNTFIEKYESSEISSSCGNSDEYQCRIQSGVYPPEVDSEKYYCVYEGRWVEQNGSTMGELQARTHLVVRKLGKIQREDVEFEPTQCRNIHRRIDYRMGSPFGGHRIESERPMELLGESGEFKPQGIEHSLENDARVESCPKERNLSNNQVRQFDDGSPIKPSKQSQEHSFVGIDEKYLELCLGESTKLKSSPRQRRIKLAGRQTKQAKAERPSRKLVFVKMRNESNSKMAWRVFSGPICEQEKQEAQLVHPEVSFKLEGAGRCSLNADLAGFELGTPAKHSHNKSNTESVDEQQSINSCNSLLETPELVSNGPSVQHCAATGSCRQEPEQTEEQTDRMVVIRGAQSYSSLSEESKEILQNAERKQTRKAYASAWGRFSNWCRKQGTDSSDYDPAKAINYLASIAKSKPSSVAMHRTAISSTWKILHPNSPNFGDLELTRRFIKGIKQANPRMPKKKSILSMRYLLQLCKSIDNDNCNIMELSMKAAVLLALSSCSRPRSDLERIYTKDVHFDSEKFQFTVTQPKEGDFKTIEVFKCSDVAICPWNCVMKYLEATREVRLSNQQLSHLFITTTKPFKNADGDTISKWIQALFKRGGIKANTHELRAISSSTALYAGISKETVLRKGNWKNSATFENHYLRPSLNASNYQVHNVNEIHSKIDDMECNEMKFISECMRTRCELDTPQPDPPTGFSMAKGTVN